MQSPANHDASGTHENDCGSIARSKSIFEYLRIFFIACIPVRANSLKFKWVNQKRYSILKHILEYETDDLSIPALAQNDSVDTEHALSTIYEPTYETACTRNRELCQIGQALNRENAQEFRVKYREECIRQMVLLWSYPESSTELTRLVQSYGYGYANKEYSEGNNFFQAIVHQLNLHNLSHFAKTPKNLCYKTIGYIFTQEPELKQFLQKHFDDLYDILFKAMQKKYVGDFIMTALSRALNVTLVIFSSAGPQIIRQCDPIATLILGFDQHSQCYHSLIPEPTPQSKAAALQECIHATPRDSYATYRTPQNTPLSATTRIGRRRGA